MKNVIEKPRAYKIKISKEVADFMEGKDIVGLRMPFYFPSETRVLFVEWAGGYLGRASLCTVIGTDTDRLILSRRVGWGSNKLDDDLSQFSIVLEPDNFDMLTKKAIP